MSQLTNKDIEFIEYLGNAKGKKTKEIAELTGFSKTTVRLIINGRRDEVNETARKKYWEEKNAKSKQAAEEQTTPPEEQTEQEILPGFNRMRACLILTELLDCLPDDLLSAFAEAFENYKKRLQSSD